MPISFYSFILIIVSAAASVVLFLETRKKYLSHDCSFFKYYAWGFSVLTLVHVPIFIINLGYNISFSLLLALYTISFFGAYFSYLLFFRGTILLYSRNNFITAVFPGFVLPFFTLISALAAFITKIETFLIYTIMVWGFLVPVAGFLASIFIYFFIKGSTFGTMIKKPHAIILSLGWALALFLDVYLWWSVSVYPKDFWILKIANQKLYYLLRIAAYIIIVWGVMLYSRYLKKTRDLPKY